LSSALRDKHAPQAAFGPYRLVSRIATSQACEIWEATREPKGTRHALKVMLPSRQGQRSQIALLRQEFSVGRRLSHPGVIRVDDFGVEQGIGYLAMEHFAAPNMKQLIRQGGELWLQLAPTGATAAAAAVDYIHGQGWIHRDIKPENFLIDAEGNVKLIDFSLARRKQRWWQRIFSAAPPVEGTRSYMSPEQIRRQAQDQRSDIYSLGCVYFELASGKLPFTGESTQDLLNKHLRSPAPSLKAANNEVGDRFAALVKRMLAKEPRERPQSMAEVRRDLRFAPMFAST